VDEVDAALLEEGGDLLGVLARLLVDAVHRLGRAVAPHLARHHEGAVGHHREGAVRMVDDQLEVDVDPGELEDRVLLG
jgi:hypothetical protein